LAPLLDTIAVPRRPVRPFRDIAFRGRGTSPQPVRYRDLTRINACPDSTQTIQPREQLATPSRAKNKTRNSRHQLDGLHHFHATIVHGGYDNFGA
jgi:hypothetical protein